MSTDPSNRGSSLIEIFKAVGVIVALPLALFAFANNIVAQPVIALVVALITAVLASAWVVCSGWTGITEVIVAWLTLIVVVLAGFVIWPRTIAVEGIIRDTAGNPVSNEEVVLFDLSGRRYETKTNAEGHYQFIDVPTGSYRVQVGGTEVEGGTEGFLVRKVQQNITVSEILATASLPSVAAVTPNTPTPTPTATPTNTLTPTPTPTATPTNTATPTPDAVIVAPVNLRSGPGTVYEIIGTLSPNQVLTVTGRIADTAWLQVSTDQMQEGWVVNWAHLVTLNLPTEQIPIVSPPPTPIPTPTPTATPTPTPISFQNFEPDNGTPPGGGNYFWDAWFTTCSFESTIVREGSRAVRVDAHAEAEGNPGDQGGTMGINPSSSEPIDLSSAITLSVWVYDTQGNNTVELKLRDYNDALSNAVWSEMHAEQNQWTEITWSLSDFAGVDLSQIKNIELYEWWDGVYYFDAVSWQ